MNLWPNPADIEGISTHQGDALTRAFARRFGILTGGPGTGKSRTTAAAIQAIIREHGAGQVAVAAPTGKAAVRITEALAESGVDLKATTIHRMLCVQRNGHDGKGWGFAYNELNPLPYRFVFIDELSMLGTGLGASLFAAFAPGTHVFAVGDPGQLPPVEHGAPLRDLLAAGIPHGELAETWRNAGDIVRACAAIRAGEHWESSPYIDIEYGHNFKHIETRLPVHSLKHLENLLSSIPAGYNPAWDVQVLCAVKENSEVCKEALNKRLQAMLNPGGSNGDGAATVGDFRLRDKVMNTSNGWSPVVGDDGNIVKLGGEEVTDFVANGEIGKVVQLDRDAKRVDVMFESPNRTIAFRGGFMEQLELAYAVTVHKCVHPDTIVETSEGLLPIKSIAKKGIIGTHAGSATYRNFVHNKKQKSRRIVTSDGYEITASRDHKCEVWRDGQFVMIEAREVVEGDWVRVKLGVTVEPTGAVELPEPVIGDIRARQCRFPTVMTLELAEFLGLMVADGTIYKRGIRLVKRHPEVVERFRELGEKLFGLSGKPCTVLGTGGHEFSSTVLSGWLSQIDGICPNEKAIPECVLRSRSEIQAAFLRGLFEDGCVNVKRGKLDHVQWCSSYPTMVRLVRAMLLRFGIICGVAKDRQHSLYIYGENAKRFGAAIGFISKMKNDRLQAPAGKECRYRIPVVKSDVPNWAEYPTFTKFDYQNARLTGQISRDKAKKLATAGNGWAASMLQWHFTKVAKIEETTCDTMCVEVPRVHRFLQNGFGWGNSQGSQWPVVVYMSDDYRGARFVACRELVYTALSRAQKLAVTIGSRATMEQDCRRVALVGRKTFLAELVREGMAAGVERMEVAA